MACFNRELIISPVTIQGINKIVLVMPLPVYVNTWSCNKAPMNYGNDPVLHLIVADL
jgi:hypothetical protein